MTPIEQAVTNPEFYKMDIEQRRYVLSQLNEDFGKMDAKAQSYALNQLETRYKSGGFGQPGTTPAPPGARSGTTPAPPGEDAGFFEGVGNSIDDAVDYVSDINPRDVARGAAHYLGPTIEGLSAVGGGLAGSVGGPVTAAVGAGLGFAGGTRLVNALEKYGEDKPIAQGNALQQMKRAAWEDVHNAAAGATLEAAAPYAAHYIKKVATPLKKVVTPFKTLKGAVTRMAEKRAGKNLANALGKGGSEAGLYSENIKEANALEREIPNLKFTAAEASDNPAIIQKQRAMARSTGKAANEFQERQLKNVQSVRDYYQRAMTGKGGMDEASEAVAKRASDIAAAREAAEKGVETEMRRLHPGAGPEDIGEDILGRLREAKSNVKAQVNAKYSEVGDEVIPTADLNKEFQDILKPYFKNENMGKNAPQLVKDIVEESAESMTLNDLQGLRSTLGDDLADVQAAGNNTRLERRLTKALKAISEVIESGGGAASARLKAANSFFKTNYAEVFKQGEIGQMLRPGFNREASRVPLHQVPNKIFNRQNLSSAKRLTQAIGEEEAGKVMADYAAYDLAKSMKGSVTMPKLKGWLENNKRVLDHFGIYNKFDDLVNAQAVADVAVQQVKEFEKSAAQRLLKADINVKIKNALSGVNPTESMRELVGIVKNDKVALNGLQNSFADMVMSEAEMVAKEMGDVAKLSNSSFSKIAKKYDGAMKVLYRNAPEKLRAIENSRKAVEIMARKTSSKMGGGSDTFEHAAGSLRNFLNKITILNTTFSVTKAVANQIAKLMGASEEQVIQRALLDPEYAYALERIASGKVKSKELASFLAPFRGESVAPQMFGKKARETFTYAAAPMAKAAVEGPAGYFLGGKSGQ
jgi:hypothetical protein